MLLTLLTLSSTPHLSPSTYSSVLPISSSSLHRLLTPSSPSNPSYLLPSLSSCSWLLSEAQLPTLRLSLCSQPGETSPSQAQSVQSGHLRLCFRHNCSVFVVFHKLFLQLMQLNFFFSIKRSLWCFPASCVLLLAPAVRRRDQLFVVENVFRSSKQQPSVFR